MRAHSAPSMARCCVGCGGMCGRCCLQGPPPPSPASLNPSACSILLLPHAPGLTPHARCPTPHLPRMPPENDPVESLPDGQLCCVLAMEEAGRDLEAYRLSGYHQARSVLLQASGSRGSKGQGAVGLRSLRPAALPGRRALDAGGRAPIDGKRASAVRTLAGEPRLWLRPALRLRPPMHGPPPTRSHWRWLSARRRWALSTGTSTGATCCCARRRASRPAAGCGAWTSARRRRCLWKWFVVGKGAYVSASSVWTCACWHACPHAWECHLVLCLHASYSSASGCICDFHTGAPAAALKRCMHHLFACRSSNTSPTRPTPMPTSSTTPFPASALGNRQPQIPQQPNPITQHLPIPPMTPNPCTLAPTHPPTHHPTPGRPGDTHRLHGVAAADSRR